MLVRPERRPDADIPRMLNKYSPGQSLHVLYVAYFFQANLFKLSLNSSIITVLNQDTQRSDKLVESLVRLLPTMNKFHSSPDLITFYVSAYFLHMPSRVSFSAGVLRFGGVH